MTPATSQTSKPKDQFIPQDPYKNGWQEIQRRFLGGSYAVFSPKALSTLSPSLDAKFFSGCVFIKKEVLWSKDADQYQTALSKKMDDLGSQLELYKRDFLQNDQVCLSDDLVDLFRPVDNQSRINWNLIQTCVFVSKSVFTSSQPSFVSEIATETVRVTRPKSQFNKAVTDITQLMEADQKLKAAEEDPETGPNNYIIYSIN